MQRDASALHIARCLHDLFTLSKYISDPKFGTQSRSILLQPEQAFMDAYFVRRDVLCFITESKRFQFRDLETMLNVADSLKGIERRLFFVITHDPKGARGLCRDDTRTHQRDYVILSAADAAAATDLVAAVQDQLRTILASRNHFSEKDPVSSDADFFARNPLVDKLIGNLGSGRCSVILGLRRIGKTSILKRLELVNKGTNQPGFWSLLINANAYRNLGAAALIRHICVELQRDWHEKHNDYFIKSGAIPPLDDLATATAYFQRFVGRFIKHSNQRLLLMIDDFQEIVPTTHRDTPWNREYIDFAATLKSTHQEDQKNFVFLLASTNSNFIRQEFRGEQNPFVATIEYEYISLFSREQVAAMLEGLGRPMGVSFASEAVDELYRLFGGHPFLTREFCSQLCEVQKERPMTATAAHISAIYTGRHRAFDDHFGTILENLRAIFPNEYQLVVEMAGSDDSAKRLSKAPQIFQANLVDYGILDEEHKFRMGAMVTYLIGLRESEQYGDVAAAIAVIEASLRQVIAVQYRIHFREAASERLTADLGKVMGSTVAVPMRGTSAKELLRSCGLPQLAALMKTQWQLFEDIVPSQALLDNATDAVAAYYTTEKTGDERVLTALHALGDVVSA